MLYLYASGPISGDTLVFIFGVPLVVGFAVLVIVLMASSRGRSLVSVGEAQAIGQAPSGRPVRTLDEYYGGLAALGLAEAHRKAGGFRPEDEPDVEDDGSDIVPDGDRAEPGDDDQFPHGKAEAPEPPAVQDPPAPFVIQGEPDEAAVLFDALGGVPEEDSQAWSWTDATGSWSLDRIGAAA